MQSLKQDPWPQLLKKLDQQGPRIMIDLLLDCSLFTAVRAGKGNLYQLSGKPISELKTIVSQEAEAKPRTEHSLSAIVFVGSHMLYGREMLNCYGQVRFGLHHKRTYNILSFCSSRFEKLVEDVTDFLNRYSHEAPMVQQAEDKNALVTITNPEIQENTVRLMMGMFPRQFHPNKAFSSVLERQNLGRENSVAELSKPQIPKRLRGIATHLVQKLQIRHKECSYIRQLQRYCPVSPYSTYVEIIENENLCADRRTHLILGTRTSRVHEEERRKLQVT